MEFAYDWFLDDNPEVQKRVEKARAEGRAEGYNEGGIQALQQLILMLIQQRFPGVVTQTKLRIEQIQQVEKLEQFFLQISFLTNEAEVRQLLSL